MRTKTHTLEHKASAMPRDTFTDLRVIDVGGARATNKIQNKGSVLSAYIKNITQDQTPKAQQQEQNRRMGKWRWRRETRAKATHQSTSKEELSDPSICWKSKNLICLQKLNAWSQSAYSNPHIHTHKVFTLRGLSTYVEVVETLEGSVTAAEDFACCCWSSSVLTESRQNAVQTEVHSSGENIVWDLQSWEDTYLWFCSISSRADKADVPFFPCGGTTGSVGYGGIGLVTCSPFIGVPFCYMRNRKRMKVRLTE